jgi:hypothetical protein
MSKVGFQVFLFLLQDDEYTHAKIPLCKLGKDNFYRLDFCLFDFLISANLSPQIVSYFYNCHSREGGNLLLVDSGSSPE